MPRTTSHDKCPIQGYHWEGGRTIGTTPSSFSSSSPEASSSTHTYSLWHMTPTPPKQQSHASSSLPNGMQYPWPTDNYVVSLLMKLRTASAIICRAEHPANFIVTGFAACEACGAGRRVDRSGQWCCHGEHLHETFHFGPRNCNPPPPPPSLLETQTTPTNRAGHTGCTTR